jgi:large subunit ribosomal protein L29
MKKRAVKELKDKSVEALEQDLAELQKNLFALRSQAVTQKLENPHSVTRTRHDIARIKTLLSQKKKVQAA